MGGRPPKEDPTKPTPAPSPSSGGLVAPTQNSQLFTGRPSNWPLYFTNSTDGTGKRAGNQLKRGFMTTPSGVKPKIFFNFMYNPNTINASYDVDQSRLPVDVINQTDPASIEGVNNLVGGVSMSFRLLINRAVETQNRKPSDVDPKTRTSTPGRLGVLHDLGVFERLVGALGAGQIISNPVEVYFNGYGSQHGLNFRGYIVAANTSFMMFNQYMIPTHAEIDIMLRQMFVDPTSDTTAMATTVPIVPASTSTSNTATSAKKSPNRPTNEEKTGEGAQRANTKPKPKPKAKSGRPPMNSDQRTGEGRTYPKPKPKPKVKYGGTDWRGLRG